MNPRNENDWTTGIKDDQTTIGHRDSLKGFLTGIKWGRSIPIRAPSVGHGAPVFRGSLIAAWFLASLSLSSLAHALPGDTLNSQDVVTRGKYVSVAADCMACHSAPHGGKPFAGGYGIDTPLGKIYSTNITPSTSAGIGSYSEAEFSNAIRRGIRRDGRHLYPAMPYTSYAKMSDTDVSALYAYFMHGVAPVDEPISQKTDLPFPFGYRGLMSVWNGMFLDEKPFQEDHTRSAEWNRGAYLSKALAHCDSCHTPRNAMMSEIGSADLSGASLGSWYAPNITSDPVSGVGGWTDQELYQYLKTGHVAGKAQAAGPMAEAIGNSLQHLNDSDLKSLVTYVKQSPPIASSGVDKPRYGYGKPSASEVELRGTANPDRGWQIFSGSCAACHQVNATGTGNNDYPSLFHNTATGGEHPDNLIATIVFGLTRDINGKTTFMPGFGPQASYTERLSDEDIAAVSNYVLTQYGNAKLKVTPEDVATIRQGGPAPMIAKLVPAALIAFLVFIVAVVSWIVIRRRKSVTVRPQHSALRK
ncbi:cytochrome c [Paraburkholderia aromaticivorans]|uniref:cytochrome c n=1 Tax=Paraburkholderia aromaticivorans TaxID=2026199 RepID=UPI00145612EF|nr:cytochrome c [Paraburkholderia aromaticivorans]